MIILRWVLTLPIIIVSVFFAISHRQLVELRWSPFHDVYELPLYGLSFALLGLGFILGCVAAWFSMSRIRQERRQQKKHIKKLEKEVEDAHIKKAEREFSSEPLPRPITNSSG